MDDLSLEKCPLCKRFALKPKPSRQKIILVYCKSCGAEFDQIKWQIDGTNEHRSLMHGRQRNVNNSSRYLLGSSQKKESSRKKTFHHGREDIQR